jgi:hypothetical protein
MRNCKAIINKLAFPIDGCLNYNVQLWYEFENTYVYAGYGRYTQTLEQAEEFAKEYATVPIEYK